MTPLQELIEKLDIRISELDAEIEKCDNLDMSYNVTIAKAERHGTRYAKEVAKSLLTNEQKYIKIKKL